MKRLIIAIALLLTLAFSVLASPPRVVDDAGLLTDSQIRSLTQIADTIASTYQMDAVIVTVNSLGGKTAQAYADDYFDYNGYGIGAQYSGILFLVAMNDREWAVSTCGDAIKAVKDYEIDSIMEDVTSDLSAGRYYQAFDAFLSGVEEEYGYFASGVDTGGFSLTNILISIVIGAVVAGIAILVMRSKMNTAVQQHGARSYITDGSYDLFRCHDIYLYSHTSKTRKPESSSSGGGTHRSSSGRSHGGRSGRF